MIFVLLYTIVINFIELNKTSYCCCTYTTIAFTRYIIDLLQYNITKIYVFYKVQLITNLLYSIYDQHNIIHNTSRVEEESTGGKIKLLPAPRYYPKEIPGNWIQGFTFDFVNYLEICYSPTSSVQYKYIICFLLIKMYILFFFFVFLLFTKLVNT